jgi:hypothetical protein
MKPALIAALSFTLIVGFAPMVEAQLHPANVAAPTQDQNPPAINPSVGNMRIPPSNDGGNNQSPEGNSPAQWILVIVTAITAGFICWQAWETRRAARAAADSVIAIQRQTGVLERQAKASEDAAQASQKTAEAIVKIERAWIDVYLTRFTSTEYRMEVTNCGRTVAKIKNYSLASKLSDPGEKTTTPYNFEYSTRVSCSKLLEPRDTAWIAMTLNLIKDLGKEDLAAVWNKKKGLAYYGIIRYDDTAGEPHETEFCYYFEAAQESRCLLRVQAAEYNTHT